VNFLYDDIVYTH